MTTAQPQSTPAFQADDEPGRYRATRTVSESDIIEAARDILVRRYQRGTSFESPQAVRDYLMTHLATREYEAFAVLFLDNRHRLIEYKEMFRGTLNGTAVYPREVVRQALLLNAAACIVSHNHPSGVPEPSSADEILTSRLKDALSLVDIRLLDHFVIGGAESVSFADRGLL
ncbi:MAG: RadC family protein [Acidiferrobacterales bacterium]